MTQVSLTSEETPSSSRVSTRLLSVALALVGLGMVYLSGFANSDVLHNGAHDSRHGLIFPCH